MKVRALGEPDVWVGYYGHIRRRGGDVFKLEPIQRKRKGSDGRERTVIISAEQQFSPRWMEKVSDDTPETRPAHFNKVGRGDARRVKDAEARPPVDTNQENNQNGGGDSAGRPSDQMPI